MKIYQVETSSQCLATCSYCPNRTVDRPQGHMSMDTFKWLLPIIHNREFNLHGFGEPLLNPDIFGIVSLAVFNGKHVGFHTNGAGLTQPGINLFARYGLKWIRIHENPYGVKASYFKPVDGLEVTSHRVGTDDKPLVSWAGQANVNVPEKDGWKRCSFLKDDWNCVLWNGALSICCHDMTGNEVPGPDGLCKNCSGYVFSSPRDIGGYDGK